MISKLKNCLECGFREKNDSSLFCSNCGKSFENTKVIISKPKLLKSNYYNDKKWEILRIFLIIALILNTFALIETDFSITYLFFIQFFILVLIFIDAVKSETARSRNSKY